MRHGGNIDEASRRFGIETAAWLDLSTGINPRAYPVAQPSPMSLARLPSAAREQRLTMLARSCYGASPTAPIVAAPGSQILIQLVARLRSAPRVAIVVPTYSEHAIAWTREGGNVTAVRDVADCANADVVVIANPNNPDGRRYVPDGLVSLAGRLAGRGGLLVVDEAFADVAPEVSVTPHAGIPGLIVLRSFGKMYGLGGIRLGFALGHAGDVERLGGWLGPWAVSGAAIETGIAALGDHAWLEQARLDIAREAGTLSALLTRHGLSVVANAGLFTLASHEHARAMAEGLARQGVWVRTFDYEASWLRFGLPGDDEAMARLDHALGKALAAFG